MCRLYNQKEYTKAFELALELYRRPELPRTIRAACCSILGTSDNENYLTFAKEAVDIWEEIHRAAERAHRAGGEDVPESLTRKLVEARGLLRTAQADERDDGKFVWSSDTLRQPPDRLPEN